MANNLPPLPESSPMFTEEQRQALGQAFDREFPPNARQPIRLPEADPWDKRTGIGVVATFEVTCKLTPVNDGWVTASASIELHDGSYKLSKDGEIARVAKARGLVEQPELLALAWTKKVLSNGGAHVLGLYEANPGHITYEDGSMLLRWFAQIGSRLSVAVVRLDGNLEGMARIVPVE